MDKPRLAQLDAELRRIFVNIPRPECTKSVARSSDEDWVATQESWKASAAEDHEQQWWDLTDVELEEYHDILMWLPPDAFRFYYTAFLSYALRHWKPSCNLVIAQALESVGSLHWAKRKSGLEFFTDEELKFISETLMELWCDPAGKYYACVLSILTLEREEQSRSQKRGTAGSAGVLNRPS